MCMYDNMIYCGSPKNDRTRSRHFYLGAARALCERVRLTLFDQLSQDAYYHICWLIGLPTTYGLELSPIFPVVSLFHNQSARGLVGFHGENLPGATEIRIDITRSCKPRSLVTNWGNWRSDLRPGNDGVNI